MIPAEARAYRKREMKTGDYDKGVLGKIGAD